MLPNEEFLQKIMHS